MCNLWFTFNKMTRDYYKKCFRYFLKFDINKTFVTNNKIITKVGKNIRELLDLDRFELNF